MLNRVHCLAGFCPACVACMQATARLSWHGTAQVCHSVSSACCCAQARGRCGRRCRRWAAKVAALEAHCTTLEGEGRALAVPVARSRRLQRAPHHPPRRAAGRPGEAAAAESSPDVPCRTACPMTVAPHPRQHTMLIPLDLERVLLLGLQAFGASLPAPGLPPLGKAGASEELLSPDALLNIGTGKPSPPGPH